MAAKYQLQDLLSVRVRREEQRSQELQDARKALVAAEERVVTAQQALDDFMAIKPQKVDALYAAVMKQVVDRDRLDQLKVAVAALDTEELTYRRDLELQEEARDNAAAAVEQAQVEYQTATKKVTKLDTHKETWKEEVAKEEERAEESEMEEFTPLRRAEDDDDFD